MDKTQKLIIGSIVAVTLVGGFVYVSKDIWKSKAGSGVVSNKEDEKKGKVLNIKTLKTAGVCRKIYLKEEPVYQDEVISKRVLRLCRIGYAAHYDPLLKMPLNITQNLNWRNLEDPVVMPEPKTVVDPDFPVKEIATPNDYITTEYYAQGFLTDYKQFYIESPQWSKEKYIKQNQIVYNQARFSSISFPIVKYNFLDGIWAQLHEQTLTHLKDVNKLTIISGPVFLAGQSLGVLGESKIPIPTHFYKIIYSPSKRGSSVYVIPNKEIVTEKTTALHNPQNAFYCKDNAGQQKYCTPDDFLVKFRDLETIVGQEFLPNLTSRAALRVKQDIREVIERKKERPAIPVPE